MLFISENKILIFIKIIFITFMFAFPYLRDINHYQFLFPHQFNLIA